MLKFWEHAIGYRRPDVTLSPEPFECDLEEAQDWCNFVVLRPAGVPQGCRMTRLTIRPETLQQAASLRMTISGESRAFRLKQFHLDWWVPTSSDANLTAPGKPFEAAGIVGYQGRDYKGRQALCIHRYGAVLELAILEGQFHDEELHGFLERLEPQIPEAVRELAALPFAHVSYHARKGPGLGSWNYDLMTGCRWSASREVWKNEFAPSQVYYPCWLPPSYLFDSVGTRQEPASHHWEYQLLFRHGGNLTDNLWVRAVGEETEKLLWIAPGLDRRMGIQLKSVALENRTVRIGSTSEPYGERFAQWIEKGVALEVHARASRHIRPQDFSRFLDSLATGSEAPD
ncbi:MAG: hypothetical protein HY316_00705 [Acidobacteria bacterium]|nr:hypothetical protein [Acidobacteriota bacterium]